MNCPANTTGARALDALQPFNIKEAGREGNATKYRTKRRPWGDQSGTPSVALSLLIHDDGEHGAYKDHVDGDSGSLYQLAERMNLPRTPRAMQSYDPSTATAYTDLADYCTRRGWPLLAFQEAGWCNARYMGNQAIKFPVATGTRYRLLDGKGDKYVCASGTSHCLYGLKRAVELAERTGQPLVLCNGEASTIVAQWYGVAAFCIAGGEGSSIEKFIGELPKELRYLVALDCDGAGRKAAPNQLAALRGAGLDARAVDLNGGDKFDLADFATLHQAGTATALATLHDLGTAEQTAPTRFWLTEDEIDTLRPPTWLVKGVVAASEVTMVIGQSDAGKTFLVVDMAKRVAQHYPVMYIAAEDASGIRVRKRAWELHHNSVPNGNFLMMDTALNLLDSTAVDAFIAGVRPLGLKMIVVDTLSQSSAAFGADENSNTQMAIVMAHCERIAHATGAAVVLLHHTTKDGGTWRGASAIRGNTYGFLEVSKDDESIKLECGRIKNTKPFDPRFFKLREIETNILDEQGNTITNCVIVPGDRIIMGDRLTRSQIELLEHVLLVADAQGGAKPTELQAMSKLPVAGFYRALKRLRELGFVSKGDKHTDPYSVTQAGRERLAQVSNDPALQLGESVSPTTPPFEVNPDLDKPLSNGSDSNKMLSNGSDSNSGATYHLVAPIEAVAITPINADLADCEAVAITPIKMLSQPIDSTEYLLSITPTALAGRDDSNRENEIEDEDDLPKSQGDVYHDERRIRNARAHIAQGEYKKARSVASLVCGCKEQLDLYAEIERAEADAHQHVRTA